MNRFLFGLVLAAAAGCSAKAPPPAPEVAERPHWGMLVSTADLAGMAGEMDLVVVHVAKDPASYDAGHVPGAHLLPYKKVLSLKRDGVAGMLPDRAPLAAWFDGHGVGPDTRVVFYDDDTGGYAARGWLAMGLIGRERNAALLDGQLAKWRAEGRPLETVNAKAVPAGAGLQWVDGPSPLVDLASFRAMVAEKRRAPGAPIALLDARPPEEFSGEKPGKAIARPGHIPGAVSLPLGRLVESRANPVLRPPAELARLLEEAGAGEEDLIVAHCRTGRAAALLYFAARMLDRPVALYDGSYIEWQGDPSNPVER